MVIGAIHPPNNCALGNVIERVNFPTHTKMNNSKPCSITTAQDVPRVHFTVTSRESFFSNLTGAAPPLQATNKTTHTNVSGLYSNTNVMFIEGVNDIELRRQRRRASMQRYRRRQQDLIATLTEDVSRLREEVEKLDVQRDTLAAGVPIKTTALNVVAEYFRLFRYGLKVSCAAHVQRDFLLSTMSPNVFCDSGFGVDKLLEDYRQRAVFMPDYESSLVRIDICSDDSFTVTTTVSTTITANSMRLAFPHLVSSREWSPIAIKLLGQRFRMRGSTYFVWDNETSRMKVVQCRADLLTPMLELLGDIERVAYVFEKALITPECTIKFDGTKDMIHYR